MRIADDTVWLSLGQMEELFGRDKSVISRHLRNIFQTGELSQESVVAKTATVQNKGSRQVTRIVDWHNLDAIISVGYRAKSWLRGQRAQFYIQGLLLREQGFSCDHGFIYFIGSKERNGDGSHSTPN